MIPLMMIPAMHDIERTTRNGLLLVMALAFALAVSGPSAALAQSTQPAVWTEDQQVDIEMGAFEDPGLLFLQTLQPDPQRHLELFQPFDQQPLEALGDFSPAEPAGPPCIPAKARICP